MEKLSGINCGNGIVHDSSIEVAVMSEVWKDSGEGEKSVCVCKGEGIVAGKQDIQTAGSHYA